MLTSSIKTLMLGGRIVTASALLATTAVAQTTTIDTPQGNTVVVPDDALEEQPSGGFVRESDYPRLENLDNDMAVAETLIAQGYSDVVISREGPIMTVTAIRGLTPIELVYSTANGRLVSVDGVETRPEPEGSSANDQMSTGGATSAPDNGTEDGRDDGDADEGGMGDGDTGTGASDGETGAPGGDGGEGDGDASGDGGAAGDGDTGGEGGDSGEGSDSDGGSDGSSGDGSDGSDGSSGDGGSGGEGGDNS